MVDPTPAPPTLEEIAAWTVEHTRIPPKAGEHDWGCTGCFHPWPCPTTRLLQERATIVAQYGIASDESQVLRDKLAATEARIAALQRERVELVEQHAPAWLHRLEAGDDLVRNALGGIAYILRAYHETHGSQKQEVRRLRTLLHDVAVSGVEQYVADRYVCVQIAWPTWDELRGRAATPAP